MSESEHSHSHGEGLRLEPQANEILQRGLAELLRMTEGLDFRPLPSEKYPLPLCGLAYDAPVAPATVRQDVLAGMNADPVSVLESALALLELHEGNQKDIADHVPEDMPFMGLCFSSKRCNGWTCVLGDADPAEVEAAVNARWQFGFMNGRCRQTGVYVLLNMLARYACVYGRIAPGDGHAMAHFVEDHCPGIIICSGGMTDLQLTLSLAAMKMGVPAVVPSAYPFPLGRSVGADTLDEIADAVVQFPNIRRRLVTPDIVPMPEYCDPENRAEDFEPAVTWGDTPDSFFLVRKGSVSSSGCELVGTPGPDLGVIVTIEAEPLDAFDRAYIEETIAGALSMVRGVNAEYDEDHLHIHQAEGTNLDPARIGDVLLAAVQHEFPKLKKARVEVIFGAARLADIAPQARAEKTARRAEIESATEDSVEQFYACVGCSPFAPDHVCCLTPDRPPQCNRPYGKIKTGALYGYDDTSNIHHSKLHRNINSFQVVDKGRCLDPVTGEWEGLNRKVSALTHGRTPRVLLHSLDENPHTGCGCFRLIMFKTDAPHDGIGIMDGAYKGRAPDGRAWKDLYYALAGKQAPGIAGASPPYLFSPKFLEAHGGWDRVVWVSPKIAEIMGDKLPPHVEVATDPG